MFLFVWWMSCWYNGWALPLQINQTWHCPTLEHLGRPRDRIKGLVRPWTVSVPNMHSELKNGYPTHFSHHHHLHWLCLLVISYFCLMCYSHILQCFCHGNSRAESGAARQYSKSIDGFIIQEQNYIFRWVETWRCFQLTHQSEQHINSHSIVHISAVLYYRGCATTQSTLLELCLERASQLHNLN